MELAAFVVACLAAGLASLSLGWQVFTWRKEHRFAAGIAIVSEGIGLGSRRYPARAVVTNEGGTVEWIDQVALHASYEREINRRIYFNSPELVRNPARSEPFFPSKRQADAAFEDDPVADLSLPEEALESCFPAGPHAICPDCRSEIPVDASVCRFCGFRIGPQPEAKA